MNLPIVHVPAGGKIAVVGDIHEHKKQFNQIVHKINPSESMFLVSVGDLYDKGYGVPVAEEITDYFRTMNQKKQAYVVRGNHELKHIRKAKQEKRMTKQLDWLSQQPLAISFLFNNGSRVTVVHGGVRPGHTWDDLNRDVEVAYIRSLDEKGEMIKLEWAEVNGRRQLSPKKSGGVTWHQSYDGRFGYIAAGHEPQKDGVAKFYNFSCNLDSACYETGVMSCQIFGENGKEELFTASGEAKRSVAD